MKWLICFSALICWFQVSGQAQTYYVQPNAIDPGYSIVQDSHAIILNPGIENNKLFLWIGGTGSNTTQYGALMEFAADLGYHVINLSYVNDVTANSLTNDTDPLAFDNYRQEICFGTPLSPAVSVDPLNSIAERATSLINYLTINNPGENWDQFLLPDNSIDWSKVATGGHSQGSGHAAYIGQHFVLDRILMFSGPNDYSLHFSGAGNWLTSVGASGIERHYSYLSFYDEAVDYWKQFANIEALGMTVADDSTLVDPLSSPYNNSHCLYTKQTPGLVILYHNVPVKNSFTNHGVWEYMLTDPTAQINEVEKDEQLIVFPNPANKLIYLEGLSENTPCEIRILTLLGQEALHKTHIVGKGIDVQLLTSATYILEVNSEGNTFRTVFDVH